tara:strand:- start:1016 stop:1174 length:159 start_codon:yes stop_codon:yes gene_type:complete
MDAETRVGGKTSRAHFRSHEHLGLAAPKEGEKKKEIAEDRRRCEGFTAGVDG